MKTVTQRTLAATILVAAVMGASVRASGTPASLGCHSTRRRRSGCGAASRRRRSHGDGRDRRPCADARGGLRLALHRSSHAGPGGRPSMSANSFGATALMWAAPRGENVRVPIENGADVTRASNGWAALTV
jgi:hypothetical protein